MAQYYHKSCGFKKGTFVLHFQGRSKKEYIVMHTRPYEKLVVWQETYRLCLFIYHVTVGFPASERYGLQSQLRRSASSVPLNIAEGSIKRSAPDKRRFMEIAHASLEELHCGCKLATDLKYLNTEQYTKIVEAIGRCSYLLTKFSASIL